MFQAELRRLRKIIGLNVCGLRSKVHNGIFDKYAKEYDILCLSETKLAKITDIDFSGTCLNDYHCYIKEKTINSHTYGGVHGLCMLVKNNLVKHTELITGVQSPYVLWVKFSEKAFGFSCIIGSVYLPGESATHSDKEMFDTIYDDIFYLKGQLELPICLIGDMNSRTGNLNDILTFEREVINNSETNEFANDFFDLDCYDGNNIINKKRVNTDKTVNANGRSLIKLCKENNVIIINGRTGSDRGIGDLTFKSKKGSSTIDYCITSPDFLPHIQDFQVDILDKSLSDKHSPIILTLITKHSKSLTNQNEIYHESDIKYDRIYSKWCDKKLPEFQSNFDPNKIDNLYLILENIEINGTDQSEINSVVKDISNVSITAGININISKKSTNSTGPKKNKKIDKPWFDHECRDKRRHFVQIKRRLLRKKIKSYTDITFFNNEAKIYTKFIKMKTNLYNKKLHEDLRNLKYSKPKEYWNLLNPKKHKINNSININPLHDHFRTLGKQPHTGNENFTADDIPEEGDEILNKDFTTIEIHKLINKLKNNKSCGIDNIINEFLKFSPKNYKNVLVKLFNVILKTGIIPSEWCISFISPIYKNKGPKNYPNNYRGISIISCLGKLFSALINERLTKFADLNEIIGEEQAGFRAGYSTQDHIFTLHAIIETYLNQIHKTNKKKRLYCAFIDYQKAFDLVDRSSLWTKLLACDIKGKIMKLIFNLYQNTKACVKLNNKISQSFNCNIGVRQGDNLSPLLFALFINDFEQSISEKYNGLDTLNDLFQNVSTNDEILTLLKLYVLLYADDTIIMAENPNELQLALNAVSDYCQTWKLKINIDKTKIIRFSKRKPQTQTQNFWLNGELVELVESYVYLGTTISFNGKFTDAIEKQINQAHRALFAIKSKKEKYNLPIDIVLDLFDKMISPVLLYGCEIWGFENLEKIEIFYRKFLKYILKVNYQTTNCMVYGETGRTPLSIIIKTRMVCFWHKISTGLNTKLSYRLLYLLNKLNEQNQYSSPWLKSIEQTLNSCNMRNIWLNPKSCKPNQLKKEITEKLTNIYKQDWLSQLAEKNSCITYRTFKNEFNIEKYLMLPDSADRINISKFRCRNSKIPVVILGYANRNIPYENRTCSLCNLMVIGDEFHYILQCPVFQLQRQRYLENHYIIEPDREKNSELFKSTNFNILRKLAKFITEINGSLG